MSTAFVSAEPAIEPIAAIHFERALTAVGNGDRAGALGALMAIDCESWAGIRGRLSELRVALPELDFLLSARSA